MKRQVPLTYSGKLNTDGFLWRMGGLGKSDMIFSDQFICLKNLFWGYSESDSS